MADNQTVIVTGGAGVIGSHLVEALLNRDHNVIVIDDLSSGQLGNLPNSDRLIFYKRDIKDPNLEDIYLMWKPKIIFHLAANYANESSIKDPIKDLETNIKGTLIQLQIAHKLAVERFVYASSSCVYAPSDKPLSENSKINPHTPYGISKIGGEYYCNFFKNMYDLPITILRYFNSFGPREEVNSLRGVIPQSIYRAINGDDILITGDGNEKRDFTYIDDTVKGTILAAFAENGKNQTFNIGTGEAVKITKLAETIQQLTGHSTKISYSRRRIWDKTTIRKADISKAKELLGYKPDCSLTEGLKKTVEWYKTHQKELNI